MNHSQKREQQNKNFSENPLDNYFEFYKVLEHISLSTGKTELNIESKKPYILVAKRHAKQLNKTYDLRKKKENNSKIAKLHGNTAQCSVSSFSVLFFFSLKVYLIFLFFPIYFAEDCRCFSISKVLPISIWKHLTKMNRTCQYIIPKIYH